MQAIGDVLAFRGRLSRLGYWRWQLALVLITAAITFGAVALTMNGAPRWVAALAFAPMIVAVAAAAGVIARRLHDRGRAAWWLLVFVIAPWGLAALSVLLAERSLPDDPAGFGPAILAASLASIALNVWGFVEIGLLRGSADANRFGPPPA